MESKVAREWMDELSRTANAREALIYSYVSRVAGKIGMARVTLRQRSSAIVNDCEPVLACAGHVPRAYVPALRKARTEGQGLFSLVRCATLRDPQERASFPAV